MSWARRKTFAVGHDVHIHWRTSNVQVLCCRAGAEKLL